MFLDETLLCIGFFFNFLSFYVALLQMYINKMYKEILLDEWLLWLNSFLTLSFYTFVLKHG